MAINDMMIMELAGIFSSRCLSIFMACETINVPYYTIEVKLTILDASIGPIFIRYFTSSTSWILHNLRCFTHKPSGFRSNFFLSL